MYQVLVSHIAYGVPPGTTRTRGTWYPLGPTYLLPGRTYLYSIVNFFLQHGTLSFCSVALFLSFCSTVLFLFAVQCSFFLQHGTLCFVWSHWAALSVCLSTFCFLPLSSLQCRALFLHCVMQLFLFAAWWSFFLQLHLLGCQLVPQVLYMSRAWMTKDGWIMWCKNKSSYASRLRMTKDGWSWWFRGSRLHWEQWSQLSSQEPIMLMVLITLSLHHWWHCLVCLKDIITWEIKWDMMVKMT